MPEHQKMIYYLTGKSLATTKDSPFIEVQKPWLSGQARPVHHYWPVNLFKQHGTNMA
jgi:uncharacterized phage-associated protein